MPLAKLQPHPAYERLVGKPCDLLVDSLFTSLIYNDELEQPIEVLPDGTVLRGYEYVAAAEKAGRAELDVIRLDGLQAMGEAVIESHVIESAVHDGNISRMAKLRCLQRAIEISDQLPRGWRPRYSRQDLTTAAMELFGKNRRSVQHFIQALKAPREVQDALDAGMLNVHEAKAVAGLKQDSKDEVALAIRGGGVPREVVKKYITSQSQKHKDVTKARDALMKSLERGLRDLEGRIGEVGWLTVEQSETLARARGMLEGLGKCSVIDPAQQEKNLEELFGRRGTGEVQPDTAVVS
jgi:hypothetical protein